jgi:hypothetical protein
MSQNYLHPLFQTYLLQEIRKIAGNPLLDSTKKCFFIATHSLFYIDIRTVDELKHSLIFQPDKMPRYVTAEKLGPNDLYKLNQNLFRLNTHHKQFLFSPRSIFVEGTTDFQLYSLIQERRGRFIGSSGSIFIDVEGKDGLNLFYRLCKQLQIDCQLIVDLDVLVGGNLRQSVSNDERCSQYLQRRGIGMEPIKAVGELLQKVDSCINDLLKLTLDSITSTQIQQLYNSLVKLPSPEDLGKKNICSFWRC